MIFLGDAFSLRPWIINKRWYTDYIKVYTVTWLTDTPFSLIAAQIISSTAYLCHEENSYTLNLFSHPKLIEILVDLESLHFIGLLRYCKVLEM